MNSDFGIATRRARVVLTFRFIYMSVTVYNVDIAVNCDIIYRPTNYITQKMAAAPEALIGQAFVPLEAC